MKILLNMFQKVNYNNLLGGISYNKGNLLIKTYKNWFGKT